MHQQSTHRSEFQQRLLVGVCVVSMLICGLLPQPTQAQTQKTRNVAIVIWNGAEILDWAGPSEVFVAATYQGAVGDHRPFNVYTVSKSRDPIVSQGFVDVIPDFDLASAPKPDIVVFPGGGTSSVLQDAAFQEWATTVARQAEIALSVCTGAFVLGQAGLLDGKDVTTWYGATSGLAQQFPQARVHEGRRFIDNGQVVTTAGVSAGIDGALHVVARLLGRDVAERTAEYMEYLWAPHSYLSKQYSWLNPNTDETGRALQLAAAHVRAGQYDQAIAVYKGVLAEQDDLSAAWYSLGNAYYQAEDFAESADAFVQAAVDEKRRSRAYYNAACSAARHQDLDQAFEYLESAVEAGFNDMGRLTSDEDLAPLRGDARLVALQEHISRRQQQVSR